MAMHNQSGVLLTGCARRFGVLLVAIALTSCAGVEQSSAPPAPSVESVPVDLAQRRADDALGHYSVIADASEIRILTFRDGAMARLGHNHVIVSTTLSGDVWLDEANLSAGFTDLSLPAASFEVDDPELRAEEGAAFADPIPDGARSGTRENMLGAQLLDAARYAFISARCGDIQGDPAVRITCLVQIAGQRATLDLPLTLRIEDNLLTATGEASIGHAQLGLSAFSAGGGAIRVAEQMTLRYRIVAQRLSR